MTGPTHASVLVAPDKFKGSLPSDAVAREVATGIEQHAGDAVDVAILPLADGGDGSVDAALSAGFSPSQVVVPGPTGRPVAAMVARRGGTVLVEVAGTCGLQLLPGGRLAPVEASSRGLGTALRRALEQGPDRVVLALGGSASTDGGLGLLLELGARVDADEVPAASLLARRRIDLSGLPDLGGVDLVLATDVSSPLLGREGAASVFGPQKGASAELVGRLDDGLGHLVEEAGRWRSDASALAALPGAGAAGGLGFAGLLLGGRVVPGADFFLDLLDFDRHAAGRDLVVTGEGRLDEQSLAGKLPVAVARRVTAPTRVEAVVGRADLASAQAALHGIAAVHELRALTDRDPAVDPGLTRALLRQVGTSVARRLAQRNSARSSGLISSITS